MPVVDPTLSERIKALQDQCAIQEVSISFNYDPACGHWVGWIGDEEDEFEGETLEDLMTELEIELERW